MTEKIRLTPEEAIACLPDGDLIHTLYSNGFVLVGADWDRQEVIDHINKHNGAEIAGPAARRMNHGICLDAASRLFCEHDEAKLAALEVPRG